MSFQPPGKYAPLQSTITNMHWVNRKLACKLCGQPLFKPEPSDAGPGNYNYLTQEQMAFAGLVCANLNCPSYISGMPQG